MTKLPSNVKKGRKQKWGEPTRIIALRLPRSRVQDIKRLIKYVLENNIHIPDSL